MGLRDWEGFEAQTILVWNVTQNGAANTSVTRGSWSRASWKLNGGSTKRNIPGTPAGEFWFGFGMRFPDVNDSAFAAYDATGGLLDYLFLNNAGHLEVRSAGGTLLATGTRTLTPNVFYYIEWDLAISDASGISVVRVDEAVDINASGLDTKPGSATTIGGWGQGALGANAFTYMDDVYIDDAGFQGDCAVPGLFPNGAGDLDEFSVSGVVNAWDAIDERPHDSDATYIWSTTAGQRTLVNIEDLATTLTDIKGVKIQTVARKTDAGSGAVAIGIKYDSNGDGTADTVDWASDQTLGTAYSATLYERHMVQDPVPSGWTWAEVNALEIGVRAG